jgi:hypothetical protein
MSVKTKRAKVLFRGKEYIVFTVKGGGTMALRSHPGKRRINK